MQKDKTKIAAVIFDLDGTVLDNEGEWEEAFRAIAIQNHVAPPSMLMPNGWWHEPGIGITNNWKRIVIDPVKAEEYARLTWNWYWMTEKTTENIRVTEGVDTLLEFVKEQGWVTGLATGSHWNVVESELEQLNLVLAFDITTTGEEVLMQKPDPEIYLLSAQKLGVDPEECIVVEDSIAGIRSAVEAGCRVFGLVSAYAPRDMMEAAGATWVVESLAECSTYLVE